MNLILRDRRWAIDPVTAPVTKERKPKRGTRNSISGLLTNRVEARANWAAL